MRAETGNQSVEIRPETKNQGEIRCETGHHSSIFRVSALILPSLLCWDSLVYQGDGSRRLLQARKSAGLQSQMAGRIFMTAGERLRALGSRSKVFLGYNKSDKHMVI
jgi:hypothetical protein